MFLVNLRLKSSLNFLAHCYLSCSNEELLVGNFITDFLSPSELNQYEGEVMRGIELHKQIDSYTDQHSDSLKLRTMLRKRHGKYASVAVDLIWDYFLCRNWSVYSGVGLQEFADQSYEILIRYRSSFPVRLDKMFDGMLENNFLLAYKNKDRMRNSLAWMDRRTRFPSNFVDAIHDLEENEAEMNRMFQSFFPDLITFVEEACSC